MREIKILTLSLRNFKGCETLTLDFGGQSASIYGDNATGKTTIYDALTWLLFGKDSRGRGDFEIKPLGPDNKVKDHAAVTSVEAALLTDGIETRLKKTYFEKWSTKRGSATETYDGNTSEYFVDEVPVKKYEFEQRVGSIVDEELFRVLTNVSWFCEGLDWKSRRKALFQVCEVPDDRLIMAENPQFSSLLDSAGALSLDDYKKKLTAQRKALNGARNTVPARLDEQRRIIDSLSTMDFEEVREQRSAKSAQMDQLTLSIEPDPRYLSDYDSFYEAISAPVDYHTITMPHGQTDMSYKAKVVSGSHKLRGKINGKRYYYGLQVQFQPLAPQREPS